MTYKVVLIRSEEGYSVSCPSLPGCASQGATEDEALENIKDAIREYVAVETHGGRHAGERVLFVDVPAASPPTEALGKRKPFKVRTNKLGLPPFTNVNELIHLLECPRCNPAALDSRREKD